MSDPTPQDEAAQHEAPPSGTLEGPRALISLTQFEANNPEVALSEDGSAFVIDKPWADDTVSIRVPREASTLIDAINAIRLPPRLTAIWHLDTRDLEFIFGPLRITDALRQRNFTVVYKGQQYECGYGDASDRLELIGGASRPVGPPSATEHRNIAAFRTFGRMKRLAEESGRPFEMRQTTFWIRNVLLSETDIPDLARHLNFYMFYFDRQSPRISLHEESLPRAQRQKLNRYPFGPFPKTIAATSLDPYLLALWDTATTAPDPIRRFLYSYQILEYGAFYFVRDDMTRAVRRLLAAPDLTDRLDEVSRQVLDLIADDKASDEAKLVSLVQQTVDPAYIWSEIEPRAELFAESTVFEGGLTLPALIKQGWSLDDFKTAWIPKLPDALRRLRNGVVHAREQRQSKCVMPSRTNQALMLPWSAVALATANQVVVYARV
jgi:hypothetical protein